MSARSKTHEVLQETTTTELLQLPPAELAVALESISLAMAVIAEAEKRHDFHRSLFVSTPNLDSL